MKITVIYYTRTSACFCLSNRRVTAYKIILILMKLIPTGHIYTWVPQSIPLGATWYTRYISKPHANYFMMHLKLLGAQLILNF